jgi:hypothetical protein
MKTTMSFELTPVGTRWPSGTYSSAALLDITGSEISSLLGCELNSGTESGLGQWHGIGIKLRSGAVIELIEHVHRPVKGFELRVDSNYILGRALDETLALLGVTSERIRWRSPLI